MKKNRKKNTLPRKLYIKTWEWVVLRILAVASLLITAGLVFTFVTNSNTLLAVLTLLFGIAISTSTFIVIPIAIDTVREIKLK
jgi:hypothetical protein